jgi:TRAP-type C4-dicarboxylate transport system permease small subunit
MNDALKTLRSTALAAERNLTRAAVTLGCLALVVAISVGAWQVIARFVLFRSASWSEPLIQASLIWMTYLALCGAMRSGTLISVDVLLKASRGRARIALRLAGLVAIFALLAVLLWFGSILCWKIRFQNIAGLNISAAWVYAALPVGSLLSMLALAAHTVDPPSDTADTLATNI